MDPFTTESASEVPQDLTQIRATLRHFEVTQIDKVTHEVTHVQAGGKQGLSGHQVRLRHFFSSWSETSIKEPKDEK